MVSHEAAGAAAGLMGLFVGGFLLVWLLMFALMAFSAVFWIWMIVDCAKRTFPKDKENDKVLWILVVVLGGIIGAIIYYFVVKRKG